MVEKVIYYRKGNGMENKISIIEEEQLEKAIQQILEGAVYDQKIEDTIPLMNDLTDANKIYKGKCTMLFVDIRGSTLLTEQFEDEQLVKIYRSYTRVIIQGIRYSGGTVRDFMGDGILAVFTDSEKGKSEEKSLRAARYITTVIDKILNPALDKHLNGFRISCGIGVSTGQVMMTKVGMKGLERDEESENEYGIAWIGNCTNYACKHSGLVSNGAIFIDKNTFSEIDLDKDKWSYVEQIKSNIIFKGYIAEKYYLELEDERKEYGSDKKVSNNREQVLLDTLGLIFKNQLITINEQSIELGKKEEKNRKDALINHEFYLELTEKEATLNDEKYRLLFEKYNFKRLIVQSGHCKTDYVIAMKKDFWENNLRQMFEAGVSIGKTESEMKADISYAMVDIYQVLELYTEAYDYLVEQARGHAWINPYKVKQIVEKTGHYIALVSALKDRLSIGNIEEKHEEGFYESKDILTKLGYWM